MYIAAGWASFHREINVRIISGVPSNVFTRSLLDLLSLRPQRCCYWLCSEYEDNVERSKLGPETMRGVSQIEDEPKFSKGRLQACMKGRVEREAWKSSKGLVQWQLLVITQGEFHHLVPCLCCVIVSSSQVKDFFFSAHFTVEKMEVPTG